MNNNNQNTTRLINFSEYINRGSFHVALYQRDFVWNYEKIKDFIHESIESFRQNKSKVFCGTIYLKDKGSMYEIIDGQQRTTFLYIVNKIFRGYLETAELEQSKIKNPDFEQEAELEKIRDILKKTSKFNIEIVREEEEIEKRILKKNNRVGKLHSNLKDYIEKEFAAEDGPLKGNSKNVSRYLIHFYTHLELVEIKTENYNTNDVFKSINSKGKKLSEWDLIRNDIYKFYSKEGSKNEVILNTDEILDSWEKNLKIKKEELVQSYLIYKNEKFVRKSELSTEFENASKNNSNFVNEFYDFVVSNNQIVNEWSKESSSDSSLDFKWFFHISNEMGATQIKVVSLAIMLKIYEKFTNDIPSQVRRLLVNFVNYVIIWNGRANIFGGFFEKVMPKLMKLDKDDVLDYLADEINNHKFYKENIEYLSDEDNFISNISEFKQANKLYLWLFATGAYRQNILKHLTDQYEHVLPQSLTEWNKGLPWKNIPDEEIREKYLNKIGNMILLNTKLNNPLNNEKYEVKYKAYLNTKDDNTYYFAEGISNHEYIKDIQINKHTEWTPEVINERTKMISTSILEIFKEYISIEIEPKFEEERPIFIKEKTRKQNDVFESLKKYISEEEEWASLKNIYEKMIKEYSDDLNDKRWKSEESFKAVIRRTIQNNCVDMEHQHEGKDTFIKNPDKDAEYKMK